MYIKGLRRKSADIYWSSVDSVCLHGIVPCMRVDSVLEEVWSLGYLMPTAEHPAGEMFEGDDSTSYIAAQSLGTAIVDTAS